MKNFTKYLLLLGIISLFGYNASAQTQGTKSTKTASKIGTPEYLLVKKGFKIFKLGATINEYDKHIKKLSEKIDNMYEVVDKNMLSIGNDIKINSVILITYKGQIMAIDIFVDKLYKDAFLAVLQAAYGQGDKENPSIENYIWGTNSNKVILSYNANDRGGQARALFVDRNIGLKLKNDKKTKDRSAIDQI